jgi:putative Mg2+ transporter-C (MgtC) family protein
MTDPTIIAFLQLAVALFLGALLGIEREYAHKTAGMRTYALVAMGCCLMVVVSTQVRSLGLIDPTVNADPLRMAAAVIMGIGFIGSGLMFHSHEKTVVGVTTSAGLWVAAGVGIAVGFKLYAIAIAAALLTIFTFTVLWYIEKYLTRGKEALQAKNESDSLRS